MKKKVSIYLAGTIKKEHENADESYWTDEDMTTIGAYLKTFDVLFLNPAFRSDDLSDELSVFGRDMLQVFSSNFVFVDARNRRGLGVGAEMMWAKINKIPVITWAPRNTHYHKDSATILGKPVSDYIHPFVESLSDKIVENLRNGAQWIEHVIANPHIEIKDAQYIGSAMQHYKERQLHHDTPMKEMLSMNEELMQRAHRLHPHVVLNTM